MANESKSLPEDAYISNHHWQQALVGLTTSCCNTGMVNFGWCVTCDRACRVVCRDTRPAAQLLANQERGFEERINAANAIARSRLQKIEQLTEQLLSAREGR